jgi:hypothetical protein
MNTKIKLEKRMGDAVLADEAKEELRQREHSVHAEQNMRRLLAGWTTFHSKRSGMVYWVPSQEGLIGIVL